MQSSKLQDQADPQRLPYRKPALIRWGDLREITQGPGLGTKKDGSGKNAPNTKGPL